MTGRSSEPVSREASDYAVRVAIEEIDILEKSICFGEMPHIAGFLNRPAIRPVIYHLQNFLWTIERALDSLRMSRRRDGFPQDRLFRPTLPPESPLATQAAPPSIWLDVTNTHRSGDGGGIARTCRELAAAAVRGGCALPVFIDKGQVFPYYSGGAARGPLSFDPDVVFVVLDTFWNPLGEYLDVFETAKARGAKIVTCFYDIIPMYFPSFFRFEFVRLYAAAFPEMIKASDGAIAISEYTSSRVEHYVARHDLLKGKTLPMEAFQLGANVGAADSGTVRDDFRSLFANRFVFLSVGTIEPRKGYDITIDAFDRLWEKGVDCRLIILGRRGWVSRALQARITGHTEFGTRLFWFTNATDAELEFAYKHTYCVIQASITEGMGLPLVEASMAGAPIIASDNAVFREVAGDEIEYFKLGDAEDLVAKIERSLIQRPKAGLVAYVSWDESLAQLVDFICRRVSKPLRQV